MDNILALFYTDFVKVTALLTILITMIAFHWAKYDLVTDSLSRLQSTCDESSVAAEALINGCKGEACFSNKTLPAENKSLAPVSVCGHRGPVLHLPLDLFFLPHNKKILPETPKAPAPVLSMEDAKSVNSNNS